MEVGWLWNIIVYTDKLASGGAFSFGAPAKTGETPAEKPASTGFAFGSSKSTESSAEKPASSMFSFGAKATTTTTVESIPKAAESFAFGAKKTESPKKSTEPPPAAFGGFAFGSKSVPEKKESPKKQTETNGKDIAKEIAKKSADEGNKETYSDEYLAHLKALNLQVRNLSPLFYCILTNMLKNEIASLMCYNFQNVFSLSYFHNKLLFEYWNRSLR